MSYRTTILRQEFEEWAEVDMQALLHYGPIRNAYLMKLDVFVNRFGRDQVSWLWWVQDVEVEPEIDVHSPAVPHQLNPPSMEQPQAGPSHAHSPIAPIPQESALADHLENLSIGDYDEGVVGGALVDETEDGDDDEQVGDVPVKDAATEVVEGRPRRFPIPECTQLSDAKKIEDD